ncbi:MAG: FliH/SctL family protein [Phycisphaeraceae bacterium]
MALIKSQYAVGLIKDAVVLDLGDLGRQAERLRQAAQAKAELIIEQGRQHAKRLTDAAHAEGFAKGHAEGLVQGVNEGRQQGRTEALAARGEQFAALDKAWSENLARWDEHRQTTEREARRAVLTLALKLAERVVHRVVEVDATVITDQLANALAHVLRPADLIVRICPQDRQVLAQAMPQLAQEFPQFQCIALTDDASVAQGGCVVSYGQGRIDATLATQLRRVTELLLPDDSHVREEDQ